MSHYEDDDGSDFFFSVTSAKAKKQFQEQDEDEIEQPQSIVAAAANTHKHVEQDAAVNSSSSAHQKNKNNNSVSPSEIIQISQKLVELCKEAPKVIQELSSSSSSTTNDNNNSSVLPKISTSELRRQQTKISDFSTRVAIPLQKLTVKWEEDVITVAATHHFFGDNTDDAETASRVKESLENGNSAVAEIRKQKYVEQLKELIGERKRELRLVEDLLNVGVW